MLLLFALLILGQPAWYFVIELTVLNVVFLFVLKRHDAIFRSLLTQLAESGRPVPVAV
jgi:hypothetical protein